MHPAQFFAEFFSGAWSPVSETVLVGRLGGAVTERGKEGIGGLVAAFRTGSRSPDRANLLIIEDWCDFQFADLRPVQAEVVHR